MKIRALTRSLDAHTAPRTGEAAPLSRNLDPALHPFDKPREYTRALNAAKLERLFAKPFVGALEGHADGVYSLATDLERLGVVGSGAGDGEIRLWDIPSRSLLTSIKAHSGVISSLVVSPLSFPRLRSDEDEAGPSNSRLRARRMLSCSTDRTVKLWDADPKPDRWGADWEDDEDDGGMSRGGLLSTRDKKVEKDEALLVWHSKTAFNSLSHHANQPRFASSSSIIQVWDINRGSSASAASSASGGALRSFEWGSDSINCVRFNPSETEVLASAGSDRSVVLYDLRSGKPLTKMVMRMRANDIAWNPIEPTTFAIASEDHNLYTFDMRKLDSATQIYKDHVAAVMSVGYSPTGQELVSGSYDRSLRLWDVGRGNHSREVYHAARMQRIFAASYTLDSRFVLSGSDDGNVRIWKARAGEKLGVRSGKELAATEYRDKLREKWQSTGDVGRISKQRRVPKAIVGAQKLKKTMTEAIRVKEERRRKHTRSGNVKPKAARKDAILARKE